MLTSLKLWFGQYSLLLLLLLVLISMPSCSKLPSLLSGGGPNVAANVQAGKTNTQTLGTTNNVSPTVSDSTVGRVDQSITTTKLKSDRVETIVVNEIPVWLVLLFGLLCGFLIPSPQEIIRSIVGIFRRK